MLKMMSNEDPHSRQLRRKTAKQLVWTQELDLVPVGSALLEVPTDLVFSLSSPCKTSVSQMQEIAVRRRGTLQYDVIAATTLPVHSHTVKLTYTEATALTIGLGTARSKQEAKHNAAQHVIEQLKSFRCKQFDELDYYTDSGNSSFSNTSSTTLLDSSFSNNSSTGYPSPVQSPSQHDYVSMLNQLSQQMGLLAAKYDYSMVGQAHRPVFTAICTIAARRVEATGASKKDAKNQAAKLMLEEYN